MSIEVHVRIRPGVEQCVWSSAETVLYSTVNPNTRYVYNKVHPSNSSNRTIFQGIEAIVHAAYDGKNTTIMAYGQTGSGKTHSMIGVHDDAGIVPRAARLLLELKKQQPETIVQAYYTEIYNESVRDLLEPQRGELQLHDAPDGGVMFEKKTVNVESFEDFLKLQTTAERNRKYGVTNLNDHSSRSHIILTFEITRPNRSARSVLNLVDLAGSESAARANTDGQTLREGGFINRSLLTLGNVVDAIVEKRPHVPYRAAKLTRVLRTCLGGSGITLILCCINPSRDNFEQTVSALRFTQRAMKIRNDPVVVLPLPPLFTHQYSDGAKQLIDGMQECSASEYQRGLRDAYMYCNITCNSVVGEYRANVGESLHGLANAQRLLIAHDHAAAIDRIGRLYVQVNEETRQKTQNEAIATDERRRQREAADQIDERKAKIARLEIEVKEKTCTADNDLAEWEYQLRAAQKKQVNEVAVLMSQEQTRRARILYEWAVCMERVASRCGPRGENIFFSALESQQKRSQTPPPTSSNASGERDGEDATTANNNDNNNHNNEGRMAVAAVTVAALRNPPSKTTARKEMCVKLAEIRQEVAQLEMAHEMVAEDVTQAKAEQQQKKTANAGTGGGVVGALDADEEELLLSTYEGVSDAEIERQQRQLEQDEKHLMEKARRDVRAESLRRVRESLRLDREVPSHRGVSSHTSTSPSTTHGRPPRELRRGEVVEEDEVDRRVRGDHGRDDAVLFDEEDDNDHHQEANDATQRWRPMPDPSDRAAGPHGRRQLVSPTLQTTQRLHRNADTVSSSSVPTSQSDVADYNAEVNNALCVIEQMRKHLLSQQGSQPRSSGMSSSARRQAATTTTTRTSASAHRAEHVHVRPARAYGRDPTRMPSNVPLADLFDVSEGSQSQPSQSAFEKENVRRGGGGGGGLLHGTMRGLPTKVSLTTSSSSAAAAASRHYEVIADSEDDELFDMRDTDDADDAPPHGAQHGREGSPPVGIAARRQYERQHSSEPRPKAARAGGAQNVERALYAIPSNSQSPSPSMERRSRSRRQY